MRPGAKPTRAAPVPAASMRRRRVMSILSSPDDLCWAGHRVNGQIFPETRPVEDDFSPNAAGVNTYPTRGPRDWRGLRPSRSCCGDEKMPEPQLGAFRGRVALGLGG